MTDWNERVQTLLAMLAMLCIIGWSAIDGFREYDDDGACPAWAIDGCDLGYDDEGDLEVIPASKEC